MARTQFVGALPSQEGGQALGRALIGHALTGLAAQGVARDARLALDAARTSRDYLVLLNAVNEQMEHSPMPRGTWPVLLEVLGEDLLAALVDVSAASLRRYKDGQRTTLFPVASRLHFLALLVADLTGAYNEYGIRRWFTRPRTRLDGASPFAQLQGGFDPDGPAAGRVRDLATSLLSAGAT